MPHLDPEQLSLLALYEGREDPEGRDHLAACPECANDFAALRRTVDAVKASPDVGRLAVPGPQVWAGIHRELGLSESLREDPLAVKEPAEGPVASGVAAPPAPAPPSNVIRLGGRAGGGRTKAAWWHRPGPLLATAAAAALVVSGAIWALNRPPGPQELAAARLAPLAQHSASGSAKVVTGPDGSRKLEISLDKDEAKGYQEVWLIAPDLTRLVSLGVMNSTSGTFQVPTGLDLSQYPVVDVSDEPMDGNPAHSSVSIARGTLTS
ncbi:anti-sigma factor [Pseudarthrobacter sp. AG30]|uniref:anti-sigma factor domain-containing protein n=1 Tax=Micrococcaceae TaxID=1268 RepID=UPI0003646C88|nr:MULTISPECIES: anti-sigma factor [Micrococcaceae]RAX18551.1 anti-sigma factor [Pseudarthrobacter sp. AG30]TDT81687.1 anti-sigma-K factor rskA [Arthrobacter sp. AG258]